MYEYAFIRNIFQFEGDQAEKMKKAYGDFCCHKKQAEAEYKQRVKSDAKFAAFDKVRIKNKQFT